MSNEVHKIQAELGPLISAIKENSIFNYIDQEYIDQNLSEIKMLEIESLQVLGKQGEQSDTLYVLFTGQIDLRSNLGSGTIARIGEISTPGRSVNLHNFVKKDGVWDYDISACANSVIISVSKQFFTNYEKIDQTILKYLEKVTGYFALRNFKAKLEDFEVKNVTIRKFIEQLTLEQFQEKENLFVENSHMDRAFIIEKGKLILEKTIENKKEVLAEVDFGHAYGLDLFQNQGIARANIIADEGSAFWTIKKEQLSRLINDDAQLNSFCEEDNSFLIRELPDRDNTEELESITFQLKGPTKEQERISKKFGKTPHTFQHDEMDCAAASLSIICKFYGKNIPLVDIRSTINVQRDGASMWDIVQAAEKFNLICHGISLEVHELKDAPLPIIVCLDYHFVVCFKVDAKKGYLLSDPAIGVYWMNHREFEKKYVETCLFFIPTGSFKENQEYKQSIRKYLDLFCLEKKTILKLSIVAFLLMGLSLVEPIFTQYLIESIELKRPYELIQKLCLGMLLFIMVNIGLSSIREYLIYHIALKFRVKLSVLFHWQVLKLPMEFHNAHKTGDVTQRFNEIESASDSLSESLMDIGIQIISVFIFFGYVFYHSWQLGLVILLFSPFVFIFTYMTSGRLKTELNKTFSAFSESSSIINEQIRSMDTVKSLGAEEKAKSVWVQAFNRGINSEKNIVKLIILNFATSDLITKFIYIIVILVGTYQVYEGEITLGVLIAVSLILSKITEPLSNLADKWRVAQEIRVSFNKLDDYFDAEIEESNMNQIEKIKGEIEFRNVSFKYGGSNSNYVLQDFNMKLVKGEQVAIIGKSGCGKSTLISLINGLLTPTDGEVLIDGLSLNTINKQNLRKETGIILQNSKLFTGSIFENISYGDEQASMEKVKQAAIAANAHEFILDQPLGYDTKILDGGLGLSGGQTQRISIARTLYKKPAILILDEATSALDKTSERIVNYNINKMFKDNTTITITHKLNDITNYDRIIFLDQGKILETGTHEELIRMNGPYSKLFKEYIY